MAQRWAVICGVVRNEEAMHDKLDNLARWRAEGDLDGVVFSTWHDEIGRYPRLQARFDAGEFTLVELEPPLLKTVGHTIHQSKALFYGLHAVPDDAAVLKLRPDVVALNDHIRASVVGAELALTRDPGWPDIFEARIMLARSFLEAPYYLNDIIYYGQRNDLIKLANFDISTEFTCVNTAPEQFFFRGPFAGCFPILEAFLQTYPHLIFEDAARARERSNLLLESDFFLDVLAINLRLVRRYFRMGFLTPEERLRATPIDNSYRVGDYFSPVGRPPGMDFHNGANAAIMEDERPIGALLDGRFVLDDIGRRMTMALERTADPAYRNHFAHSPLRPAAGVVQLRREIARVFPDMPHRLDEIGAPEGRHFRVRGHSDRVSLMVQLDETRRLEEEVNRLRRLVDDLRAKTP